MNVQVGMTYCGNISLINSTAQICLAMISRSIPVSWYHFLLIYINLRLQFDMHRVNEIYEK
jgi:hypothetical protein